MKIKVTQEHIKMGISESGRRCPVALAINDVNLFEIPHVGYTHVSGEILGQPWTYLCLELPSAVTEWIKKFEATGEGSEFEFELGR